MVALDGEYISTKNIVNYKDMKTTFGIDFVLVLSKCCNKTVINLKNIYADFLGCTMNNDDNIVIFNYNFQISFLFIHKNITTN